MSVKQIVMAAAGLSGAAAPTDPQFPYVTMLLHGDGTNGAQNNTFVDSSTNNFAISRNGNTTQGSFSPYGENWSNYFDGTGDYLSLASNAAFNISSGAYTFETWVYFTTAPTTNVLFGLAGTGTAGYLQLLYSSGGLYWQQRGTSLNQTSYAWTPTVGNWYHIAIGWNGSNSLAIWINGTRVATNTVSPTSAGQNGVNIGGASDGYSIPGYLSNIRLIKGTDVYGVGNTSITVPTAPLTAITNTSLLTCQSNRFIDNSANNFTITRNGDTSIQRFSPFAPTAEYSAATIGGSAYFDGTGDYLTVPDNAALDVDAGDFTVEAWVYISDASFTSAIVAKGFGSAGGWMMWVQSTLRLRMYDAGGSSVTATSSASIASNSWNHIAATRSGNTLTVYVNGVSSGTASYSGTSTNSSSLEIGAYNSGTAATLGYISNVRLVKGTAVYTSNFTPPTAPLTAITNTSLLTCQSNRFKDNSANNFTITRNGDVSVQRFSPFAPTAEYSTATIGGSGYFDGAGDYLQTTSSQVIPTGSYTLEAWVYVTSSSATQTIFAQGTGVGDAARTSLLIESSGGAKWAAQIGGTQAISSITPVLNAWTYVAMTYNGSTLTLYVNGSSAASASVTQNASNTTLKIGANWGAYNFTGYISNARVSNTVRTISIPTAPFTSDANTSLLANFTNAGIYDNAMMNDLETVGNAQISTSVKKYGTGSMYFDGSGDYIVQRYTPQQNFGTGNFTIEGWFYLNSLSNSYYVLGGTWAAENSNEWLIQIQNNGNIRFLTTTGTSFYSAGITTGTWYHFAAVRSGTTITLYINGTSVGSYTNSNSIGSTAVTTYWGIQNASSWPWNGYIDDLRITKGYARYTANFTPPTEAFPDY